MRKTRRDEMSRSLRSVVARLSLMVAALAIVASAGIRTAVAQTPKEIVKQLSNEGVDDMLLREWLETMPNAEDIKLPDAAELEIYRILPSATAYERGENIVFLVGAHNLGQRTAAFDYALNVKGSTDPPWVKKGVALSGGDRHFTGFVLPYNEVLSRVLDVTGQYDVSGGNTKVCFTFSLLGQGSNSLFRDRNMVNHQDAYCVNVIIISR